MKAAESKIASPASQKKANKPFFGKGEESFFGNAVQTKLTVGKPGDPYEKEADAVADKVVQRMAAPPVQTKCDCCSHEDEKLQKKEDIGEEEQEVQRKPIFESNGDGEIQQKSNGSGSPGNSALEGQLSASRNGGSPMAPDVQKNMESAFGSNFGDVRIHDNDAAAGMNNSLNAQAFTHGSDIYFNKNKYNPKSSEGQHLLAHELTHVVQQGASKTSNNVQTFPQAGEVLPATDMQQRFYKYRNEVVELENNSKFSPSRGLAGWISSMWQNGQDVAVNVKFGRLGSGFIWLDKKSGFAASACVPIPFGKICVDELPAPADYDAKCQVIPIKHDAFPPSNKGTVVLQVCILAGFISGELAWVEGKQPDEIEPTLITGGTLVKGENPFLPLLYGDDYTGDNYVPMNYENSLRGGMIRLLSAGVLKLPNQQQIDVNFALINWAHSFIATLQGQAVGLEKYQFKIERNAQKAELFGDGIQFQLDKEWTGGNKDSEDGTWSATAQFRASYKNKVFEFFGRATYASARINGEVNLAVAPKSKAEDIFRQHAPGKKSSGGTAPKPDIGPAPDIESSMEPLGLTGYGNMSFVLVKKGAPTAATGGQAGGQAPQGGSFPDIDLSGTGAFAVSPDGYIVLAGSLRFPTKWKLTKPYDYTTDDVKDKSKHLFKEQYSVAEAPVPYGTINLKLGITLDVKTHLNPLELYEIEVSGVYSNHPEFRSEVGITPKLYIDGSATATITAEAEAAYKALGLFTIGGVSGSLTGTAVFEAYVNAQPSLRMIWDKDKDGDKPASYAIAGLIHAGGELTFALSGAIKVKVLKAEIWDSGDYEFAKWTMGNFGLAVELQEYILGSDQKPQIDFSKMQFGAGQRKSLANAIGKESTAATSDDDKKSRSGGFMQKEGGKNVEKGTFSPDKPNMPDPDQAALDSKLEQEFLMKDKLHELSITYTGTRANPKAVVEMASGEKEPLKTKIVEEKTVLDALKIIADDDTTKEIEHRERDLDSIAREADAVKQNAETAAQQAKPGTEPAVAGFDQLDDRLNSYGQKYNTNDLGVDMSVTPPVPKPKTLKIPKSNGANAEMERLLMYKRQSVGWETFEHFKGVNVAVFQYHVLKPGRDVIDEQADGPFFEAAINQRKEMHTEVVISGELYNIHQSKEFRKKYGPTHKIAVTQILTERSPCSSCRNFLGNQPSKLIITNNYHTYYLEHYSGNWIERNRNLMIRYGLDPPTWEELQKKYPGERLPDPH